MTAGIGDAFAQLRALAHRSGAQGRLPGAAADDRTRRAAVLVLFGALDAVPARAKGAVVARELDVLLTRRADTLRHHAGQVAFPGGRIDSTDDGAASAALREAQEETGLDPAGVRVLGYLPDRPVPVSDHVVTPVLAWWASPSPVRVVDHGESSHVFRVPVADLLDPANRLRAVLRRDGAVYTTPAFVADGHLIWGLTAMILSDLFDDIGWTVPWSLSRTIEVLPAEFAP